MTRIDWLLLPVLLAVAAVVTVAAFRFLGFLGIGILGLLVGVVAVNVDLEQGWPIGSGRMNTYSDRLRAEGAMSRADKAEWRAGLARDRLPIHVAKVVAAGMIILGFGLFAVIQLP